MAKGMYVGVGGIAKKVKKMYVGGSDGIARKVRKGYIGVGGVARPFFTGGELAYYGTATALSVAVVDGAAASNDSYAIFAGGSSSDGVSSSVTAYNKNLTKVTATSLSDARKYLAAARVGNTNYVLFAGGSDGDANAKDVVDAYDGSLTRSIHQSLSVTVYLLAGASLPGYAMFAGGKRGSSTRSFAYAYNESLTRSSPSNLSETKSSLCGANNDAYAIFAYGYDGDYVTNTADLYNTSMTKSAMTMSVRKQNVAAAKVGNTVLFAGGSEDYSPSYKSDVETINSDLTRSNAAALPSARNLFAGVEAGEFALFAGGEISTRSPYRTAEAVSYDQNLTQKVETSMSTDRSEHAAAVIGDYALIGGGRTGGNVSVTRTSAVDVYTVG